MGLPRPSHCPVRTLHDAPSAQCASLEQNGKHPALSGRPSVCANHSPVHAKPARHTLAAPPARHAAKQLPDPEASARHVVPAPPHWFCSCACDDELAQDEVHTPSGTSREQLSGAQSASPRHGLPARPEVPPSPGTSPQLTGSHSQKLPSHRQDSSGRVPFAQVNGRSGHTRPSKRGLHANVLIPRGSSSLGHSTAPSGWMLKHASIEVQFHRPPLHVHRWV